MIINSKRKQVTAQTRNPDQYLPLPKYVHKRTDHSEKQNDHFIFHAVH